jgi:hypothetical protein
VVGVAQSKGLFKALVELELGPVSVHVGSIKIWGTNDGVLKILTCDHLSCQYTTLLEVGFQTRLVARFAYGVAPVSPTANLEESRRQLFDTPLMMIIINVVSKFIIGDKALASSAAFEVREFRDQALDVIEKHAFTEMGFIPGAGIGWRIFDEKMTEIEVREFVEGLQMALINCSIGLFDHASNQMNDIELPSKTSLVDTFNTVLS